MRKFFIFIFVFFLLSTLLNAEYIAYYPDIPPLGDYVSGFKKSFSYNDSKIKIYIVRESDIFHSSVEILKSVQMNFINFAVIPVNSFQLFDILNNINPLLRSIYTIKNMDSEFSKIIPFKLLLQKYGIFLVDLLPGSKNYLFSNEDDIFLNKEITIAVKNRLFYKKFKKIFKKVFLVNNIKSLSGLLQKNIFNSVVINSFDFLKLQYKFKYAYDLGLYDDKLCLIANLKFWNNLDQNSKSVIWSFATQYKKIYRIKFKKFQDKILNNLIIKRLSAH